MSPNQSNDRVPRAQNIRLQSYAGHVIILALISLMISFTSVGCGKRFTGCEAYLNCPIEESAGGDAGHSEIADLPSTGGSARAGANQGGTSGASPPAVSGGSHTGGTLTGGGAPIADSGADMGGDTSEEEVAGAPGVNPSTPMFCTPNAPLCVENTVAHCNADGSGYVPGRTPCASTQTCIDGTCIPHKCEPAKQFCSEGAILLCSADGLSSNKVTQCGVNQYCDGETATCKQGICAPNKPECASTSSTHTCNATGSAWLPSTNCSGTQYCNTDTGTCEERICEPNNVQCAGNALETCNSIGSQKSTTPCESGQSCDAATTRCISPLGASCTSSSTCASNFCVDGVCCESACDGVCAQCNSSGHCTMPSDDGACGTIQCPAQNECTNATNITSGRCASVGACKTSSACQSPPAQKGTKCSGSQSSLAICDGQGNCAAPVITCGNTNCSIGPNSCCFTLAGGTCQSGLCATASTTATVECDGHSDCPAGQLCGYAYDSVSRPSTRVRCAAPADIEYTYNVMTGGGRGYELCKSPAASSSCSKGTSCNVTWTELPGWAFCAHP